MKHFFIERFFKQPTRPKFSYITRVSDNLLMIQKKILPSFVLGKYSPYNINNKHTHILIQLYKQATTTANVGKNNEKKAQKQNCQPQNRSEHRTEVPLKTTTVCDSSFDKQCYKSTDCSILKKDLNGKRKIFLMTFHNKKTKQKRQLHS